MSARMPNISAVQQASASEESAFMGIYYFNSTFRIVEILDDDIIAGILHHCCEPAGACKGASGNCIAAGDVGERLILIERCRQIVGTGLHGVSAPVVGEVFIRDGSPERFIRTACICCERNCGKYGCRDKK